MKLVKLMVALTWWFPGIGAICLSPVPQEKDPYRKGLEILKEEGEAAAIDYFRRLTVEKNNDPQAFFYYAWSLWENGNTGDSEKAARFLLPQLEPDSLLTGHCHYLLGNITRQQGLLENSRDHTSEAIRIYRLHDKTESLFNALCTLAAVEIEGKNFAGAHGKLGEAWQIFQSSEELQKSGNLGYFYELKSRVGFGKGLYEVALDFSVRAHEAYLEANESERATRTLSAVAFFRLLVGQIERGIQDTEAVDESIYSSQRFIKLSYYNAVNWLLIYRCNGQNYQNIEREIRNAIERDHDMDLKQDLNFALNWKCDP